jgi:hypothetical protein
MTLLNIVQRLLDSQAINAEEAVFLLSFNITTLYHNHGINNLYPFQYTETSTTPIVPTTEII